MPLPQMNMAANMAQGSMRGGSGIRGENPDNVTRFEDKQIFPLGSREYKDDLEKRNGGLIPGRDNAQIAGYINSYKMGALDESGIDKLIHRNPSSASIFMEAKQEKQIISPYLQRGQEAVPFLTTEEQAFGKPALSGNVAKEAVEARSDVQGAAEALIQSGRPDLAKEYLGLAPDKKGMYGGIRVGVVPGTSKLIEYSVDEKTGKVMEIGTGRPLTRGVDYEPTVGQTIMPVLGGGLQSFPNRAVPGAPLPSSPTGVQAMPTQGETQQLGAAINANAMGKRMFELVNTDKVKTGPYEGRKLGLSATTGIGLSKEDAELVSLEENLSNALLEAMRGAQVGPKEQEMFNKSLPRKEQPKKVFIENLRTTIGNINRLSQTSERLRAVPGVQKEERADFTQNDRKSREDAALRALRGR